MRKKIARNWLYLLFISPFAFFYHPIKEFLGGGLLFFLAAVIYLIVCSAVAYRIGK